MSREIKFRIFNTTNKTMYYSHTPQGYDNPLWGWDAVFRDHIKHDDTKLMQYTGLKDKNGMGIYEGDIVQTIDQMEATYNELDSNVGVGEVEVLHGFWNVGGHVCNGLYDLDDMYHIEVIGNVHENPELLEAGE